MSQCKHSCEHVHMRSSGVTERCDSQCRKRDKHHDSRHACTNWHDSFMSIWYDIPYEDVVK